MIRLRIATSSPARIASLLSTLAHHIAEHPEYTGRQARVFERGARLLIRWSMWGVGAENLMRGVDASWADRTKLYGIDWHLHFERQRYPGDDVLRQQLEKP